MVGTPVKGLQELCPSNTIPSEFGVDYGYEKGFLGYASNKYKQESKQAGHATLGDDFVIQKISDGRFSTLEDWKKAYFNEVVTSAKNGLQAIDIDGKTYTSYEDLKRAFAEELIKIRLL